MAGTTRTHDLLLIEIALGIDTRWPGINGFHYHDSVIGHDIADIARYRIAPFLAGRRDRQQRGQ